MNRITLYIVGGLILVALLAGAAFYGAQLVTHKTAQPPKGGLLPGQALQGGKVPGGMSVPVTPAPELPTEPSISWPKTMAFDRVENHSILMKDAAGGAQVEIVVTPDTRVWQEVPPNVPDITKISFIQMQVKPGDLNTIGQGSTVIVWGARSGDRVTATTVLYTEPVIANKK
jgi:hypothetical protein